MSTSTLLARARSLRRRLRRAVLARRRLLAALLTAAAVLAALRAVAPPPEPRVAVLVAARDLAAGTVLSDADVRRVPLAPELVPDGVVADVGGRLLAAPLRRGEPVTDARLVGARLADGYPGRVLVPVRFPDAAAAALLSPGDRIDVLAADPRGRTSSLVASGAVVAAVPPEGEERLAPGSGRLVLLAVVPAETTALGASQVQAFLSYALSR